MRKWLAVSVMAGLVAGCDSVPPAGEPRVAPVSDGPLLPPRQVGVADAALEPSIVDQLRGEAAKIEPLLASEAAKAFVRATSALPLPEQRTVYRSKDKRKAFTQAEFDALPEAQRAELVKKEYTPKFYYTTGYGTPLVYARPLDIVATLPDAKIDSFAGKKILDFGYGTIGHLRLLASCGAEVHGVDVEPLFRALYSAPGDTGRIEGVSSAPAGSVSIHTGQFPADAALAKEIAAAGPYDLIVSKNTLKRGYIHPERDCDPNMLVHLGVDDAAFVKSLHDNLKPGGIVMIYNICPPPSAADQPYVPWADGRCPFEKDVMESAGFEVLALDVDDAQGLFPIWVAAGLAGPDGTVEKLKGTVFVHYTVLRRK